MRKTRLFVLTLLILASTLESADAAGILPVSQLKKGMKGYGLTVFDGTRVEKFDVEIMGVLTNMAPGQDMILAHVDSEVVRKSGVVAGMSGSPIYIDGKVIGALAYSWQFAKDSVAGITPIEEMLRIERSPQKGRSGPAAATAISASEFLHGFAKRDWTSMLDRMSGGLGNRQPVSSAQALPISTPLSFSGFDSGTISRFSPQLEASGFMAVPSGTSATSSGTRSTKSSGEGVPTPRKSFAPGDAIAGVLVDGDLSIAATGTVTYVDGDKVYAFGHPFLDLGEIDFPMATAEVVGVMPNLASSFKFSNTGQIVGTLKQDRAPGVLGFLGKGPEMIPVEVTVDGDGREEHYRFRVVRSPLLSPMMLAMAVDSVVASTQRAAGERTVVLESAIQLTGFPAIQLREGWSGAQARASIPAYLAILSNYLMSNEFQSTQIESIKIKLRHDDRLRVARLVEASVDTPSDGEINPGDVVKVRAVLKPYRGESFTETFDVTIPDAHPGRVAYLFIGSGNAANQLDFMLFPPDPRNLDQVVGIVGKLRSATDLTVGLYSSADGSMTAGVPMPSLPPSVRAILSSDSTNSWQVPVKYQTNDRKARALDYIVDGTLKIDLQIQPKL